MEENTRKGADAARIFPLSEQQLLKFNTAHASQKLTPFVPQGGAKKLEYEWLTPVRVTPADPDALAVLKQQLLTHPPNGPTTPP